MCVQCWQQDVPRALAPLEKLAEFRGRILLEVARIQMDFARICGFFSHLIFSRRILANLLARIFVRMDFVFSSNFHPWSYMQIYTKPSLISNNVCL